MLEKETRDKLFSCVQRDDATAFGEFLTPEALSAVFGRFPLLSLLYLFNAKRIVKKYQTELIKERPRLKEPSFLKADELFLTRAGKCLRFYSSAEVSPLEMLAVLGRGRELVKAYALYPNASRYLPMIHKIYYARAGEGVTVVGDKLILPEEPLSFGEKKSLFRLSLCFLIVFLLVTAVTSVAFGYYGAGTGGNFYKARSAGAALSALKFDQSVSLRSDVTLSGGAKEYTSRFDGGGHVVRLTAPFAEKVTGEVCDVIFVLEEGFSGDAVILENEGKLKNVRVVAEDVILRKGGEHMGLLTAVNSGSIENCFAVLNVTVSGEGGGDCFFAPFAGSNQGTVNNCKTDGVIIAKNVDVAGIAGKNEQAGSITDCVVKASLQETSDIKNWTPNVAGVAAQNDGTIYGCTVTGSIKSVLASPASDEDVAAAYAGGIVCLNGGSVKECENQSEVLSSAQNGYAFAGGIATINARYVSDVLILSGIIEDAEGKGKVCATSSTHDAYAGGVTARNPQGSTVKACVVSAAVDSSVTLAEVQEGQVSSSAAYAGGLVALNLDLVIDCRSSCPVTATADKGYAFAGGLVSLNSYIVYQNYYYGGAVRDSLCGGAVKAVSASYNAYAGGVVAENNQGTVLHCGQTVSVEAASADTAYSFTGGIVAYNYGKVEDSFFLGSISEYDENSFSGGVCGLIRPSVYTIDMRNNFFVAGGHTSGSTLLEVRYNTLLPGTIYGLALFESDPSYARYITEILDLGGVCSSADGIKAEDIYYE